MCRSLKEGDPRHLFRPVSFLLVCLLVCVPLPYSSDRAAMSSRQKSGMSGTTRPQTELREVTGASYRSPEALLGNLE
jgi:hypothetical protein